VISGVISTAPGIIERLHDLNASAATFYIRLFPNGSSWSACSTYSSISRMTCAFWAPRVTCWQTTAS